MCAFVTALWCLPLPCVHTLLLWVLWLRRLVLLILARVLALRLGSSFWMRCRRPEGIRIILKVQVQLQPHSCEACCINWFISCLIRKNVHMRSGCPLAPGSTSPSSPSESESLNSSFAISSACSSSDSSNSSSDSKTRYWIMTLIA